MPVEIISDIERIQRMEFDLYTFDRAFQNARGEIGFPIGTMAEIYGAPHCGKSTAVYGLSGRIANQMEEKNIALADFEGLDQGFLADVLEYSEFDRIMKVIQRANDEEALDELIKLLKTDDYGVGILDSVGAISPISELEGDLGEANMGRRAKLLAQFSRKMAHYLRINHKAVFIVNHLHSRIGGIGMLTPGGLTMEYLAGVRILMKKKEDWGDGSYVMEGKVTKNKYGLRYKQFYLFMLSGKGIHKGLTAMYDCIMLGLATRGKGGVIKINGDSQGRISTAIKKAHEGEEELFERFYELLN